MAENKIIINKHFREPSAITESVFSRQVSQNKYGLGKHDFFREGEIIVCNNEENPGLYITVGGTQINDEFDAIKITSGAHIKLDGYAVPDDEPSDIVLSEDDTVSEAFGKVSKLIDDARENAMPRTGAALSVTNHTLNVVVDDYTIKVGNNNQLYVNTDVVSGGGGGEVYIPGQYISIGQNNEISVTGITPENYATKAELGDYVTSAQVETIVSSAVTGAVEYIEGLGYVTESRVNEIVSAETESIESSIIDYVNDAVSSAKTETLSEAEEYIDNKGYVTIEDVAPAIADAKEDAVNESYSAMTAYVGDAITSAKTETLSEVKEYIDDSGYVTIDEVAPAIADAKEDAVNESYSAMTEYVSKIEIGGLSILGTTVTTVTESFVVSGETYEPGTYLVIVTGNVDDPSSYRYSYNNISSIISAGKEYMTEAQYQELVENGYVIIDDRRIDFDPNVDYYTYED